MIKYTELHAHSDRSVLDSICKPSDIIIKARELGYSAACITDHGVMSATIMGNNEASKEKDKSGNPITPIKFIAGCEFYISPSDDHTLKEMLPNHPKQQNYHLTALAKNLDGVKELYRLSSIGFLEGFYYKPRISIKLLHEIGHNLIVMGACAKGPISWNILEGKDAQAREYLEKLVSLFPERFYIELMDHGLEFQKRINNVLKQYSEYYKVPMVATNDVHFPERKDHYIHSIMMAIKQKKTLKELQSGGGMIYPKECHFKSAKEMITLHGEEACLNTEKIVEQIDMKLTLGTINFPIYKEGIL